MKKYHLAILTSGWIDLILDGSKTIESRFSKVRCAPFGKVHAGDTVYMKKSSGLIEGMFSVATVETFENLTKDQVYEIDAKYCEQIFGSPYFSAHWEKWLASKHATLLHVADPVRFEQPFAFPKRDRRAWVVLDAPLQIPV